MAAGVEFSDLDWLAIVLAIVANMALGFLWYSPKFPTGKLWMQEKKIPADMKPTAAEMGRAMTLMVVGSFLMFFVLMHVFVAFRDAMTLDDASITDISYADGAQGALFTWLGFFVPVLWTGIAWEKESWRLFFVNAGYYLVTLLVAGMIFAWRL